MADFRKIYDLPTGQSPASKTRVLPVLPAGEKKTSIWQREIEFSSPFSGKEKQQFFHLLAVLMDAGLSITESLEVIVGQLTKKKSKEIVLRLTQALNEGHAFSEAAAAQEKYFSKFEIHSLRMGERAGQMIQVLFDLASYHEKRIRLQRKLSQALSYPLVVITIAGGVLFFMVNYVVPMFSDIFKRFDAELPRITQLVIAFSDFSSQYGLWMIIGFIACVIAGIRLRKHPVVQRSTSMVLQKIPVLGKLLLKIQLARFCYTLALMLRSKVSLDQALELMQEIIQYHPLKRTIPSIRKDIIEGKTLYEAIIAHSIFPTVMVQMIKVGERTARLDTMVGNLAKNLEEESEASISTLTSLLEPLLIVILGLMVGIILVSMYLPMFELSNTISA
jgi:type IV pilus assembly protein PilC